MNVAYDKEPNIAQIDIGELLMGKRYSSGLSIEAVAEAIKLTPTVIEQLESNQFSAIGSAVYVRGYLGLYAKHLGLDAAYVLDLYQSQNPTETVAIRPSLDNSVGKKQSKRHSKTLSFLLSIMTFVGLVFAYEKFEFEFFQPAIKPVVIADDNVTDVEADNSAQDGAIGGDVNSAILAADSAQNLADDILNNMPSSGAVSSVDDSNTVADAEISQGPIELESSANESVVEDTTVVAKDIRLVMTFKEDCWLKITDAKGQVLASNVYSKKRKIDVKGTPPLTAVIGRPLTIESVNLGGKKIKLSDYKVGNVKYELK